MRRSDRKRALGRQRLGRGCLAVGIAAALLVPSLASAANQTCREWRKEHRSWKIEALRRTLHGASQPSIDEAVFEMLQREAYLTSCNIAVRGARSELIGWRLVGRVPDEYGNAVVESVLEQGGFDLDLRTLFDTPPPSEPASTPRVAKRRPGARR